MAKINLQMYSFSDGTMDDTRENLRHAARMGYDGVELFAPNYDSVPADEMKALLCELKLEAVSLHAPVERIKEMIPYAKTLGLKFIGIGTFPMFTDEDVHNFARKLNEVGAVCHENGLLLTYHNHTQEFAMCGDKRIMDVLLDETNPEYVACELDAGWCASAGFDPIKFVQEHSGRVKLIHIKESDQVLGPQPPRDWSKLPRDAEGKIIFPEDLLASIKRQKGVNCAAGKGLVDWAKLQTAADAHGCGAYVVEREKTYEPCTTRLEALEADIACYRSVLA